MVKPSWPKFGMLNFGLPVNRTSPEKEKKKGGGKMQGGILATTCPMTCPSDPWTSQHMRGSHSTQFWAILEWERSERKWTKEELKLETKCWPEEFHFWTTLFNVFKGWFLRFLSVFHYFHVWGTQICWENILFRTKGQSIWCFKISVHLGLWTQFSYRFCFDCFRGCGSPNWAYDDFLKRPICLVCCHNISANDSLYFGIYRSWSEVCS